VRSPTSALKILIVAPFCSLPGEPYFNRFLHLAELFSNHHDVTLVTSRFRHFDKKLRSASLPSHRYSIVLLDEPGYSANVSLARLRSHFVFCANFRRWFECNIKTTHFDVVYSAFPLIATNLYLGSKKTENRFKLIVDVQDVWPESISAAFPVLGRVPPRFVPFSWRANRAYKLADGLVAVSTTYLQRAASANARAPKLVTYIGADVGRIRRISPYNFDGDFVEFLYLGSLSHSYDLKTVILGFNILTDKNARLRLHIIGDGPDLAPLQRIATGNIRFYGMIAYDEAIAMAKSCDVLVNPIKSNAKQSITNKLSDYLVLNKPIVNSQKDPEANALLRHAVTANFDSGDVDSFIYGVEAILNGSSSAPMAIPIELDRAVTYPQLVRFVESFGPRLGH
jgi:glycosyltransferase involved in cell wall biosynthesis